MIGRRGGLWIGGLLFAFLFGLTASKPPVSSAALHEDFASHSSPAIFAGERDDGSANDNDCGEGSSNAEARRPSNSAACAPAP